MTKIEWTDESWNPVVGCSHVSAGCEYCYAEKMAQRLAYMGHKKYRAVLDGKFKKPPWNGEVFCDETALDKPLHWKKPRRIFVCSMGDLFHPKVPIGFLTHVFDTIEQCPQHIFQILTKRPENIKILWTNQSEHPGHSWRYMREGTILPNVWLGVSVEDQKTADQRIPLLLQIPAAVRFVSLEPLLGEVDLKHIRTAKSDTKNWRLPAGVPRPTECYSTTDVITPYKDPEREGETVICHSKRHKEGTLDWAIIGCETQSPAHRREGYNENAINLVEQCKAAGVPVFVKSAVLPNGRVTKNIDEFPKSLKFQEYPALKDK